MITEERTMEKIVIPNDIYREKAIADAVRLLNESV